VQNYFSIISKNQSIFGTGYLDKNVEHHLERLT